MNEGVHHARYQTREAVRQDIFDYIEGFYNLRGRHSALGYVCRAGNYAGWLTQQKLAA